MRSWAVVGMFAAALLAARGAIASPMGDDSAAAPGSASANLPIEGVITKPDWDRRPTDDDMASDYPYLGQVLSLGGDAAISCVVTSLGELSNCTLARETPAGLGFGEAALKMSSLFHDEARRRSTAAPVGGARVTVPIRFVAPIAQPVTATAAATRAVAVRHVAFAPGPPSGRRDRQRRRRHSLCPGVAGRYRLAQARPTPQANLALDDLQAAYKATIPAQIDHYAQLYARSLTEPQLAAIVAFEDSPAGRTWAAQAAQMQGEAPRPTARRASQKATSLGRAGAPVRSRSAVRGPPAAAQTSAARATKPIAA